MMSIVSYDQLPSFVESLVKRLENTHILTLTGSMGTGKTTLVKELLIHYGIQEPSMSPTYAYVIVYNTPKKNIYHFDLYRLATADQFINLGFDEYFEDPQALIIIEWPEIIQDFLKNYKNSYAIALEYYGINQRLITEQ